MGRLLSQRLQVTFTIGLTGWAGESLEESVRRADATLYRGKAGRDTVRAAASSVSEAALTQG